jgi:hypothetical protein
LSGKGRVLFCQLDVTGRYGVDPVATLRNGTPESIRAAVAECHRQAGSAYIVGAGCEVPRDTPPENVLALRDYARSYLDQVVAERQDVLRHVAE